MRVSVFENLKSVSAEENNADCFIEGGKAFLEIKEALEALSFAKTGIEWDEATRTLLNKISEYQKTRSHTTTQIYIDLKTLHKLCLGVVGHEDKKD